MSRIVPLGILLLAGWLFMAPAVETVRVRLFSIEQPSQMSVTSEDGEPRVLDARQPFPTFHDSGPVTLRRSTGDAVRVPYPVEISARDGRLVIIADIPLEEYVAAVLAGESSDFRSGESLKAMAVAIRTYAVHFRDRHRTEGFDLCDTTHCQDFRITAVSDRFRKAAVETGGEILKYNGQPIEAYYHQDCGGVTEARAPYLPQLNDLYCVSRGRMRWTTELSSENLERALGIHNASRLEIVARTASGRASRLRVSGAGSRTIDAESFRLAIGRSLGWDRIRSDLYEVRRSGDRFVFEGYGSGHGIGLCQDGAAAMGEQGFSYREILAFYYPNTRISR